MDVTSCYGVRVETGSTSGSEVPTATEATTEGSTLETDLKSIINKLSPLLGPLPPGQSRKVKYEKGGTSVEIKVPIDNKEKCFQVKELKKAEGQPERRVRVCQETVKKYTQPPTDVSCTDSVPKTPQHSSVYTSDETSTGLTTTSKTETSESLILPRVPCESNTYHMPPSEPNQGKRPTEKQEVFEPEAKKACPSRSNLTHPPSQHPNIERCNCKHVSHGRTKRKIKWCNYLPSFPSVPTSLPKSSEQRSKVTTKKSVDSDDSGVTIPQLYKAHVGSGSYPNRFTFRAVTGVQDSLPGMQAQQVKGVGSRRYPAGDPYESQYLLAPPMQHYPRLVNQPPYVRAGPYNAPSQNQVSSQANKQPSTCVHQPVCAMPPSTFNCPASQATVTQRVCDDCQKVDMGMEHKPMAMQPNDSAAYEVDPEKARAFLGEKGEGYISVNTIPERVDVYCFDQLNTGFFRTSDHPPPLIADVAVETTEAIATRFWAELFGMVHIVIAFLVAMILQFFKFLLTAIVRPLMIGFVQLFSDYFIKPLLTVIYNGFTQPFSVCFYNVVASIRDIVNPVAKAFGFFVEPFANLVKSFRLVEIKHVYTNPSQVNPASVPLLPCPPSTVKIQ